VDALQVRACTYPSFVRDELLIHTSFVLDAALSSRRRGARHTKRLCCLDAAVLYRAERL
jgi:hypothetical protein